MNTAIASPATPITRTRTRRRLVLIAAGLLVLLAVFAALAGSRIWSARQDLLRGATDLRQARADAQPVSRLAHAAARGQLRRDVVRARVEFAQARDLLGPWRPFLAALGWIPRVGPQLAAAGPAADTAFAGSDAAIHLLDGLAPVWPAVVARGHGAVALPRLAAALGAGSQSFRLAERDLTTARAALRSLPVHSGNSTLDTASRQLREALPPLRAAVRWLEVAPAVLGLHTPSHYLLLLQNPAELRASGGFIGAVGFDTLRAGRLLTHFSNSGLPHEITSVPVPLPEAEYTGESNWVFRDANWSPDFPLSARLTRWFYGEDTGRWADGVIGIVDTGVKRLLNATGPVFVPHYNRWVSAANVEPVAQLYVHELPNAGGKRFLGAVISALIHRIETLPSNRWPALGAAIATETARRDIQLYDRRPTVESAIILSGADGRLHLFRGDFLAIVDDNRSYNKLNPYVSETASYAATVQPSGRVLATLTLHYHVRPSPANLEGVGPGYGFLGNKHDYQDFLRVYVPPGARLVAESGLSTWVPQPAYGFTQLAGRLLLRENHSRTVIFRYVLPPGVIGSSGYSLFLRRQAGADLHTIAVRVSGTSGVSGGMTRTVRLTHDRHLHVALSGVQSSGTPLPRLARTDPYLPYIYLRDPRYQL